MYNITNTKTNETTEESFTSWNALQEYLKDNPDLKQGLSTPELLANTDQLSVRLQMDGKII